MRSRFSRLTQLDSDVADAALAAALLLLTAAQLAAGAVEEDVALYALFSPLVTLPLALRRRAPLAVLAVSLAALVAQSLVTVPAATFGEFLAVVFAAYTLAAHSDDRRTLLGAVLLAGGVVVHGRAAFDDSPFEFVFPLVYFGGALAIGRLARRRGERASRERALEAAAAAASERQRIARELHDVISHSVGVMVVQAGAARLALDDDPNRARNAIEAVERSGREALAELRRLLGLLREDDDAARLPQPRLAAVGTLVDGARAAGLEVELNLEGERRALDDGLELAAYRIVQEALTNVLRHAAATRAKVTLRFADDLLSVEVEDDGRGAAGAAANGTGHGLAGIGERVALYGGTLEAGPREGGGFSVRALLPRRGETSA